jgi:A/G-specific adenine glycosylase
MVMTADRPRARATEGASKSGLPKALLAWYDTSRRDLPWRVAPGKKADAYRVWLSEVMLQQTTVKVVTPYFQAFVTRWPTVEALAAAPRDDVLSAWAGLGYYSRARNLHACAQAIAGELGGKFPSAEADLRKLPGIGPYTAAAIASIAHGQSATPVDGNIERVMARLFAVETPLPRAKPELKKLAQGLTPKARTGDYAQALMDLGATVCMPRRPSCMLCPLKPYCASHAKGIAASLPRRAPKPERPTRRGYAFFAQAEDGRILLRWRPPKGLLGGMLEVPSTDWTETLTAPDDAMTGAPIRTDWWPLPGVVVHPFTHFRLELTVLRAAVPTNAQLTLFANQDRCRWVRPQDLAGEALPSVMRKVIAHAIGRH